MGFRIVILGGGVVGLATAIALEQTDLDLDIEIYERHESSTEIGAGIVCWPNACYVLDQLGALESLEPVSRRVSAMERRSSDGDRLGALDIAQLDRRMGYPSRAVLRRDLMRILEGRLEVLGNRVRYGREVARLEAPVGPSNGEARARVVMVDGETLDADWILGAEGRMRSPARAFLLADSAPRYQGFLNWIGTFQGDEALFPDGAVSDFWGVGERFGIVPVSEKAAYWAGGVAAPEVDERDPALYLAELDRIFGAWPEPIPTILRESAPSSINKIYVHDHDPIDVWHRGNVLLLGDAAHAALPTSGQGACQALEDAWHLERCLSRHGADPAVAFPAFTATRRRKTAALIAAGRQLASSLFDTDPEACRRRDEESRRTDYAAVVAGMAQGWSSGLPIGPTSGTR